MKQASLRFKSFIPHRLPVCRKLLIRQRSPRRLILMNTPEEMAKSSNAPEKQKWLLAPDRKPRDVRAVPFTL